MRLEYYEDLAARRDDLREQLQGDSGKSPEERILEMINAINRVFGDDPEGFDPLFDKWERELEEGLTPDLDELPPPR